MALFGRLRLFLIHVDFVPKINQEDIVMKSERDLGLSRYI